MLMLGMGHKALWQTFEKLKVKRTTLHNICELTESVFENWAWILNIDDVECERMFDEGKQRGDAAETFLLSNLRLQGMIIED